MPGNRKGVLSRNQETSQGKGKKKALTTEEQQTSTSRDERERMVLEHIPLVKAIAARIHDNLPVHVDLDDLIHAGILGLLDAVDKFDPQKGVTFSSYAKYRIRGAILDSLRQDDWATRDQRRRHKQYEAAVQELMATLQREPTDAEVAAKLGVELSRWRQMLLDLQVTGLVSASQRRPDDDPGLSMDFEGDRRLRPDHVCVHKQLKEELDKVLKVLPERYQVVIKLYYGQNKTMKEIGDILGVNESRVSQIHKAALEKMAAALEQRGIRSSEDVLED